MFKQAAVLFYMNRDQAALANTQQYLAFLCLENNQIEEALHYQYRVICLYLKCGRSKEISESYYFASNILQFYRHYDEAAGCLEISLKYYNGFELGLAIRYHSMAIVALMKKDYENAKKFYLQALKFFQFHGDGQKIGEISEELTFLLKYGDTCAKPDLYKQMEERYNDGDMSKYEIMLQLANSLNNKGKNLAALRCGWRALAIARAMEYETEEPELMIKIISARIRNINK
jgi:tetratricopeptide (TPR) repeat protein